MSTFAQPDTARYTAQLLDPLDTAYGMSVLMSAASEEEARKWARTIARTCKTSEGRCHVLADFYPTPLNERQALA